MLLVCNVCSLLIHARRLRSTRLRGPGLRSSSAICFMMFTRTTLTSIGSMMRSSKHWGPTGTRPSLRWRRWRPGWVKDQPEVTHCTLTQVRIVNVILYSSSYSISVLNIIWSHENYLKCRRRRWGDHWLRESYFGRPTLGAGQVPMSWYSIGDHIRKYL